ncbi:flagellar hook-basal body protein [Priestia megaterium]|nr:flagellar hook-basal body protein [Priestia megaterium]
MFKGFYTATAGMLSQQRRTDMLTNNMSNVNTTGFKADQSSIRAFPEMLIERLEIEKLSTSRSPSIGHKEEIGRLNTGVYMQEIIPNFMQGDLQETTHSTDIALVEREIPLGDEGAKGGLFFVVQGPDNTFRYTRNGNFTLDQAGFLTTNSGEYVLDRSRKPIQLQSENFKVDNQGNITEDNVLIAQLDIAFANNLQNIVKEGNGLYRTNDDQPLPTALENDAIEYTLNQGFIERSNVDASQTMTELLTAYRAFEANQKVMQAYDRSMDKAVNEIGRVR